MNLTTELVRTIAEQVVTLMKEALASAGTAPSTPAILVIETALREVLRQVGAEAFGQFLSLAEGTPAAELECPCGGQVTYRRRRSVTIWSVFGKVTYARAYYAGCPCAHGLAPLDVRYGLQPGHVTPGLAELLTLAGIELPFEHSARWLKGFLLFGVSENTIRQETQAVGVAQAEREEILRHQSQDVVWVQDQLRSSAPVPARLYGSIDAAKVRIEPRDPTEKQAEHEAWRDVKVGCWYEAEPVPPAQRSTRQRQVADQREACLRAKNIRYYCEITEAAEFGKLMWATGCARQAQRTPELVFVCDGATWIWNQIAIAYPHALQIVDWFHAADRISKVAHAAFATPHEGQTWRERITTDLWEGRVEQVIRACERLDLRLKEVHEAITYFKNNAKRMRYDHYRSAGYFIGSGTVESGCKQIVTQRLKCSGAQWIVSGARHTAKARAAWLGGEWTPFCTRWPELPLAL